ncbi:DUF6415 family natural product biosynthesis protein [Streptomyces sp. NBC_01233]|uniref:DUF6415 family natural product biosynthesis protein n=1 Tax=Streptomyces sp. NBC_01233 TaxID=2903787 RepID=UPI002E0E9085|nr:DUF6415 family natural product biosynthesis protein [Streptomyces sp. NBC_01233]
MEATRGDLDTVAELVKRALVPYNRKPDDIDIEVLVERLLDFGILLLTEVVDLDGAAAPLADWHALTSAGSGDGPLARWNYARGLARTIHRMLGLLPAAVQ